MLQRNLLPLRVATQASQLPLRGLAGPLALQLHIRKLLQLESRVHCSSKLHSEATRSACASRLGT